MMRADRLTSAPIVGRFYLVPLVFARWHGIFEPWPVMGPAHTDIEFFDFGDEHYHIDGRFLTSRQFKLVDECAPWRAPAAELQAAPLHNYRGGPLPKPVLTKRKCNSAHHPYEHGDKKPIQDLRKHYAGTKCERGKGGWICPHRKASLGSVQVVDGVVTCPLHGLMFDAATGVALTATQRDGAAE
jgi:hypothetical protein